MTKDKILAGLLSLNKADLAAVHAAAGSLLGGLGALKVTDLHPTSQILANVLVNLTKAQGTHMVIRNKFYHKYAQTVIDFVDKNFKPKSKIETIALIDLLVGLIWNDLKRQNIRLSIGTIIVNLGRISEVFNDAYPDYLECGMAPLVLKMITQAKS